MTCRSHSISAKDDFYTNYLTLSLLKSPSRWPCCTVFTGPVKYGWHCIWLQLKSPWFKSNGRSKSGTDNNTKSSKCWSKSLENFVFFHSSDSAPAFLALPQLIHHNLFRFGSSGNVNIPLPGTVALLQLRASHHTGIVALSRPY